MDSIGLLYALRTSKNQDEPTATVKADLHINYLKTRHYLQCKAFKKLKYGYNRYLDIGVMLKAPVTDISSIFVYIPFSINEKQIEDLGDKIKESTLFCALFNSDYAITNVSGHPLYYEVRPSQSDKKTPFWLYILEKNTFKVEPLQKGSLLSINIKELPSTDTFVQSSDENGPGLYFRFRISGLDKNDFYHEEPVANDIFQNAFSKAEMLDLRVNEIREFDKTVLDDLRSGRHFIQFTKFHFFFICSSENENISGNVNYNDSRLLDSNKWGAYDDTIRSSSSKYIAYHWKQTPNDGETLKKCNIFLRTIYTSFGFFKTLWYCIIVIFLGFMGSYFCSLVVDNSSANKEEQTEILNHKTLNSAQQIKHIRR